MNQYNTRQRNISQSTSITQGGIAAVKLSMNIDKNQSILSKKFVPFLKERDSMNRLVTKLQTISPERTERKSSGEPKKEIWRQNSQVRVKSPLKKFQIINEAQLSNTKRQLDKQRSFSNADYKIKLIQAYTERGTLNHQDESIQQIDDTNNHQDSKFISQKSPIKIRRQESMHINNENKYILPQNTERIRNNGEIRKCDIKLPALLLKQYVKDMLEGNKKIKDVITQQEAKYEFPPEFEQKIIQMKRDLKKMKTRLKNWEQDRRTDDDLKHLKDVAKSIIEK